MVQIYRHKKGSVTDIPYIAIGIFTFAVVSIMVSLVLYHFNVKVQANDIFPTEAKTASSNMSDGFPNTLNGMIVFTFFGFAIVSLVLASLIPVHPIFVVFYIFELLIMIWMGGAIADTYQMIIENAALAPVASKFVLTTYFFQYFPFVIGVFGIGLAMVVYKARNSVI